MSLINQMLKDLEERSAPQLDEHTDTIKGISWTVSSKANSKRKFILATSIASILCTGIAAGSYYHFSADTSTQSDVVSVTEENSKDEIMATASDVTPIAASYASEQSIDTEDVVQIDGQAKEENIVEQPDESEARKMLAALVASGALPAKKVTKVIPQKVAKQPIIELAAIDNTRSGKGTVQKTLRPLDNSKLAEISYQQGYELIARGQRVPAEKKLLHALELMPSHIKAREILGVLYLQQERIADAAEILKQGISLSPEYMPYREIYARTFMAQNQIPEAIMMLNNDAPELNRYPGYYALLAGLYQKNEQHEHAASIYLKLIKKTPKQSQWWLGMAISLEKLGKMAEAKSAYIKARKLKLPAKLMRYVDSRLQKMDKNESSSQ